MVTNSATEMEHCCCRLDMYAGQCHEHSSENKAQTFTTNCQTAMLFTSVDK